MLEVDWDLVQDIIDEQIAKNLPIIECSQMSSLDEYVRFELKKFDEPAEEVVKNFLKKEYTKIPLELLKFKKIVSPKEFLNYNKEVKTYYELLKEIKLNLLFELDLENHQINSISVGPDINYNYRTYNNKKIINLLKKMNFDTASFEIQAIFSSKPNYQQPEFVSKLLQWAYKHIKWNIPKIKNEYRELIVKIQRRVTKDDIYYH